jgi:hypothetical protein
MIQEFKQKVSSKSQGIFPGPQQPILEGALVDGWGHNWQNVFIDYLMLQGIWIS